MARGDMEFLSECSTLTSECRERVRYGVEHLSNKKPTYSRFKKRALCHSFMALNRASDVSAADWRSQTHVKNYRTFSRVETRFFSVEEIPIKHSSLYNKYQYRGNPTVNSQTELILDSHRGLVSLSEIWDIPCLLLPEGKEKGENKQALFTRAILSWGYPSRTSEG